MDFFVVLRNKDGEFVGTDAYFYIGCYHNWGGLIC